MTEYAQNSFARALHGFTVSRNRHHERLVYCFIEADDVLQIVLVIHALLGQPQPEHTRAQRAIFRHHLIHGKPRDKPRHCMGLGR